MQLHSQHELHDDEQEQNVSRSQIIVFRLGGESYGLPIDDIKEVVLTPRITRLPLMPSFVRGVANIRGEIIAILDLEEKFGLHTSSSQEELSETERNYCLVVESEAYQMAILVREVPNTLSIPDPLIDNAPAVLQEQSQMRNYITGIARYQEQLIILIDLFKAIDPQEIREIVQGEDPGNSK